MWKTLWIGIALYPDDREDIFFSSSCNNHSVWLYDTLKIHSHSKFSGMMINI